MTDYQRETLTALYQAVDYMKCNDLDCSNVEAAIETIETEKAVIAIDTTPKSNMIEFDGKFYDNRHGGPFDRGMADCYYQRPMKPHYFIDGTLTSPKIEMDEMSPREMRAYLAGYKYNEELGDYKDWG